MTPFLRALTGWLLLALACHLTDGALHALEHGQVRGLPPASGQQEAHDGDCRHGVELTHGSHGHCLGCSHRAATQACHQDDEVVLSILRPATLAAPAGVPPCAALPGGVLGARGPPALAG